MHTPQQLDILSISVALLTGFGSAKRAQTPPLEQELDTLAPALHSYLDFREYLREWVAYHKAHERGFSQRTFLQRAGITSPSFLGEIIAGRRNLTPSTTAKFIEALRLPVEEAEFFRHLVGFCQSETAEEKQEHYRHLLEGATQADVPLVGADQFQYYENWYLSALRELACLNDWGQQWRELGAALEPPISANEARLGIQTLEQLGLLRRTATRWEQTDRVIATGHEVTSLAVRRFHQQMLDLARRSLDAFPREQRHVTGVTMSVSAEAYGLIAREIEASQGRILEIIGRDQQPPNQVCQLLSALFPVARIPGEEPTP